MAGACLADVVPGRRHLVDISTATHKSPSKLAHQPPIPVFDHLASLVWAIVLYSPTPSLFGKTQNAELQSRSVLSHLPRTPLLYPDASCRNLAVSCTEVHAMAQQELGTNRRTDGQIAAYIYIYKHTCRNRVPIPIWIFTTWILASLFAESIYGRRQAGSRISDQSIQHRILIQERLPRGPSDSKLLISPFLLLLPHMPPTCALSQAQHTRSTRKWHRQSSTRRSEPSIWAPFRGHNASSTHARSSMSASWPPSSSRSPRTGSLPTPTACSARWA